MNTGYYCLRQASDDRKMLGRKCFIFFIIITALLLLPIINVAQPAELPQVIAKLSIADFLHPNRPSALVGLEHKVGKYWYLNHQAGYLFYNPYNELFIRQSGFRLRSGIRHYIKSSLYRDEKTFFELHGSYIRSESTLEDDFCRFGCSYQERLPYNRQQELYQIMLDFGLANYINSKWLIEIGAGIGAQFGYIHFSGIPLDATFDEPLFTLSTYRYNENPFVPPITLGLRLTVGYAVK